MKSFERATKLTLAEYQNTELTMRWQEAIAFGEGAKAQSYWIRDSGDVVNIVWLNSDGIRDITLLMPSHESMFNFVPLKCIVTIEVRETGNVVKQTLGVEGNYAVHVIVTGARGDIWWVAENEDSRRRLNSFLTSVLENYSNVLR